MFSRCLFYMYENSKASLQLMQSFNLWKKYKHWSKHTWDILVIKSSTITLSSSLIHVQVKSLIGNFIHYKGRVDSTLQVLIYMLKTVTLQWFKCQRNISLNNRYHQHFILDVPVANHFFFDSANGSSSSLISSPSSPVQESLSIICVMQTNMKNTNIILTKSITYLNTRSQRRSLCFFIFLGFFFCL